MRTLSERRLLVATHNAGKLDEMRANTRITRTGGRDEATMMTVTFTSPDPRIAAGVVNEYTTLILSANTRNRAASGISTSESETWP